MKEFIDTLMELQGAWNYKEKTINKLYVENTALRRALEKIEQRANERHTGEHERDVVYAMYYIAKAAIAKAKGEGCLVDMATGYEVTNRLE